MIAAKRTIKAIQELLGAGMVPDVTRAQSLAGDYARLCADVNQRLRVCARYVGKGMVTEAVNMAESAPRLLPLVGLLDFEDAARWRDFARLHGWPVAEPVDAAAVAALRGALAGHAELEPLVRRYRTAVQRRDDAAAVEALRGLRQADPDNANWLRDLERFEKKRLRALEEECRAALKADDVPRLRELLDELVGKWLIPVRSKSKGEIVARLAAVSRAEAEREAARLDDELAAACEGAELARVRAVVAEVRALAGRGEYEPTVEQARRVDEAAAWVEEQDKQAARRKAFDARIEELRKEVSKPRPDRDLGPMLKTLQSYRLPVPGELVKQARAAIAEFERLCARRRRIRRLRVASIVATVLVSLGAVLWYVELKNASRGWSEQLEQAFGRQDLGVFDAVCERARNDRSWLFAGRIWSSSNVQAWVARRGELAAAYEDRLARREAAWAQLEAVREGGFIDGMAEITALVDRARSNAVGPDDEQRLAAYVGAWHGAAAAAFSNLVERIRGELPGENAFGTLGLDGVKRRIASVRELIGKAEKVEPIPPILRDELSPILSDLTALETQVESRAGKLDALLQADTLDAYLEAAGTYVEAYRDEQFSAMLAKILERRRHYKFLAAVAPANTYREPSARIHFEKLIVDTFYPTLPGENYFWAPVVDELEALHRKLLERWPAVRDALKALGDDRFLVSLWQYEDAASHKLVLAELPYGDTATVVGSGDAPVDASTYTPRASDRAPDFTKRTVSRSGMRNLCPMAHCRFVRQMMARAADLDASEGDVFLLRTMRELYDNAEVVSPLLKLRLMRFLCDQFLLLDTGGDTGGDLAAALREASRGMARIDEKVTVSWLCLENDQIKAASEQSAELLEHTFGGPAFLGRYCLVRALRATAMGRGVKFAGIADPMGGDGPRLFDTQAVELWALRGDPSGEMSVTIVARRDENGTLAVDGELEPGEPLFTAGDRLLTREALAKCLSLAGLESIEGLTFVWPPAWPSGAR